MNEKKAFTLAEVLITLAIIGVVAAITIPSIVANHRKRTLETQFAKTYRTLSQAVNLAIAEHGDIDTWDWKETWTNEECDEFVKKYFVPYLNVVKFCTSDNSVKGCAVDGHYNCLGGAKCTANYAKDPYPKVLLADGSMIYFILRGANRARALGFDVDINGHKKPNKVGRDFFTFDIFKETGELLPTGTVDNTVPFNEETQSYTLMSEEKRNTDCSPEGIGWYCAAKVVQDGFKINY